MPPLTVERLSSRGDIAALAERWERLLCESDADTIFLTWEWIGSWLDAYGADVEPAVLRVEDGGRLVGVAPLALRNEPAGRFGPRRILTFLGDGSADSDYLDLIARRGSEGAVLEAVLAEVTAPGRSWDLLRWNEIPGSSPFLPLVRDHLRRERWYVEETEVSCPYVTLPADWDSYLKRLKPRMRTKVRSTLRDLEQGHEVRFDRCESLEDLDTRLESLFALHAARWKTEGREGVFGSESKRRFYAAMSRAFLGRGWLRFYSLRVDGSFVAHQFCFERNGTTFLLQEGYDPLWAERGVGNALRAHVMRDCIERGVGVYDFLGGVTPHKLSWGAEVKTSYRIAAAPPGWSAALYFRPRRVVRWLKRHAKRALHWTGLRRDGE